MPVASFAHSPVAHAVSATEPTAARVIIAKGVAFPDVGRLRPRKVRRSSQSCLRHPRPKSRPRPPPLLPRCGLGCNSRWYVDKRFRKGFASESADDQDIATDLTSPAKTSWLTANRVGFAGSAR